MVPMMVQEGSADRWEREPSVLVELERNNSREGEESHD